MKPVDLFVYEGWVISQWINYTVICQAIDVFGIVTNIINIICFVKQGFKESVNVSLLGLAISDLGCLTTLIWTNLCMNPAFNTLDLPYHPVELQHLTSCLTHTTFSRLTGWITAFITLERCLCITAPLKIRNIMTPKRVFLIIVCLFLLMMPIGAPIYMVSGLDLKFYPQRNKTLIGIVHFGDSKSVEKISYAINNVFIPFSAFFVIIVCTVVLVAKLHTKSKWRKSAAPSSQTDNVTSRNQKVAKMVLMISILFIICFLPISVLFLAMAIEPELSYGGAYNDYIIVASGFVLILESINSSMNIFFYYGMSTKYRAVFRQIFRLKSTQETVTEISGVSQSQSLPSKTKEVLIVSHL